MSKGISIHVGLNSVDPTHYDGWDGALAACESDAKDTAALAKNRKFKPEILLTRAATSAAVIDAITAASRKLKTGDALLFTYSGHGGQVPDRNGDEKDRLDETFVLYDRELIDDEIYGLWSQFAPGVRIFVLSDSCHSGTVTRQRLIRDISSLPASRGLAPSTTPRFRGMPGPVSEKGTVQHRVYRRHKAFYDDIQSNTRAGDKVSVNACVILISGCQDNQESLDGDRNGLFTGNLLKVWEKGAFKGPFRKFHAAIAERMPPWQSPNFYRAGSRDARFEAETPFTV